MKPRRGKPRRARELRLALAAALLVWAAPEGAVAQADRTSARSVVRVTCVLPQKKEMVASGFVWSSRRHVVTALHAAVGCDPLLVRSEATGVEKPARVERVSLEADLALLVLPDELGVPPLQHAPGAPDTRGAHFVWGYPNGAPQMRDHEVKFSGGLAGGATTLKAALAGVDKNLDAMLAGQPFPSGNAAVLIINSGVSSGQSGAPIIDTQGRVVAIVDGGLGGGWRGENWGVLAHQYLPRLPSSRDAAPTQPSKWALLFSKVALPPSPVAVPAERSELGQLTRVRRITLADLDRSLRAKGKVDQNITFISGRLNSPDALARLTFDIYEDPKTGVQLGVPSGMPLRWNPLAQLLEARTAGGASRLFVAVAAAASHAQARSGAQTFADRLVPLANWQVPPNRLKLNVSPDWAQGASFFHGADAASGAPVSMNLNLKADGPRFLGYALLGPRKIENLPDPELIAHLMMQFAAQELTSFPAWR
jgi:hypothetical protein